MINYWKHEKKTKPLEFLVEHPNQPGSLLKVIEQSAYINNEAEIMRAMTVLEMIEKLADKKDVELLEEIAALAHNELKKLEGYVLTGDGK
jgi:hypothetical protein